MTAEPTSGLDAKAVQVTPGSGVVARHPGVVLVLPAIAPGQEAVADRLLELCARHSGELPGRRLARRVAGLLAETEPEEVPAVCLLAETPAGLVTMLAGDVDLEVTGPAGFRLTGSSAVSWVERILPADTEEINVLGTGAPPAEPARTALDLRLGTVPGRGMTVRDRIDRPATVAAPAPPAQERAPAAEATPAEPATSQPTAQHAPLEPAADAEVAPDAFVVVDLTAGPEPDEEPRAPLPLTVDEPRQPPPEGPVVVVSGIVCSRGHFNNPDAAYCSVCGISMVQRTHEYISGPRPPLGVLVFDDGATFALAGDYVLGRSPGADEAVSSGRARPLVVEDPEDAVSRVHAEIHLEHWQVFIADRGSANGTYLADGESAWQRLPPATPTLLPPGTRVRLGPRTFVFDSHHKS